MLYSFVPFQVRNRLSASLLAVAAVTLAAPGATQSAQSADHKPVSVAAHYKVSLNGFGVGTFDYSSEIKGQSYSLKSDVNLSLLMGAVSWRGLSHTEGASPTAPKPKSFGFDHESTLKSGALRLGFNGGTVETVSINPPPPMLANTVPLKREHLKDVLDPLSAVLALTQATGGEPCARKVAIFDGRQRFDLQLSYRRQEVIEGTTANATVCRVKYIPIGGYQANEATENLARSTGIEISFRHVPEARLFVPQKVVLPTVAGLAEIAVQSVNISGTGAGQVALVE
jgi:Protein of unknown function (DUF3108)